MFIVFPVTVVLVALVLTEKGHCVIETSASFIVNYYVKPKIFEIKENGKYPSGLPFFDWSVMSLGYESLSFDFIASYLLGSNSQIEFSCFVIVLKKSQMNVQENEHN